MTSVTKEVSRDFLVNKVLPALKAKCPDEERGMPIFIQQDNAWTHIAVDDPCWRSLSTKFDRQIRYKNRRTKQTYTHMLFILTYFHLYWKIIILQDIYMNTVEKVTKIRFPTKRRRETRRDAHLHAKTGSRTTEEAIQAQPATHRSKAVARGVAQGAAAPWVPCTAPSSARTHLALAVAWWHAEATPGGFLI